jgi:hypothetical protein
MCSNPWGVRIGSKCILPMSAVWYPAARSAFGTVKKVGSSANGATYGVRWSNSPVRSDVRAGTHVVAALYAFSKTTPTPASRSTFGVRSGPADA